MLPKGGDSVPQLGRRSGETVEKESQIRKPSSISPMNSLVKSTSPPKSFTISSFFLRNMIKC